MKLFEPVDMGHLRLKNRIAFAPTHMGYCTRKGEITDQVLCHYAARSKGGAGLIIVEGTGVTGKYAFTRGSGIVCIGDSYNKGLKELAELIHFSEAKAVVQLVMGQGAQALFKHPRRDLVAPSAVSVKISDENLPKPLKKMEEKKGETARPLTVDEIQELSSAVISASKTLSEVGFDGVELHGAHGYLLGEFLSPLFNKREDEYGGSFVKRLTLPLQLIEGIRKAVKSKFVIGFRISGNEHVDGGLSLEDSVSTAKKLEEAGVDYLHLSSGCYQAYNRIFPDTDGAMVDEAKHFATALEIPVICPNIHDPKKAEVNINDGLYDIASLSRALLADPDWPRKAQEERIDDINRCIFCYTCVKSMLSGTGVRCSQNPELGWERFIPKYYPEPRRGRKKLRS